MTSNDAAINLQKTREDKKFFSFFFKHGGEFGKHLGMILIWIFQLLILWTIFRWSCCYKELKNITGISGARRLSPEKSISVTIVPTHNIGWLYFQGLLKRFVFRVAGFEALLSIWMIYFPGPGLSKVVEFMLLGVISFSDHKCNPCPKTWKWYQTSCYYFAVNEEKTWPNSRKNCMDKNSTLVKIDSLEEKVRLNLLPWLEKLFMYLKVNRISESHGRNSVHFE